MTQKAGFKHCRTDTCILYRVNKLGTAIVILYVDATYEIGYKPALMDKIECIKKEYKNKPMGELEDFIVCTIKHDLIKMTLNISQPDIINTMM